MSTPSTTPLVLNIKGNEYTVSRIKVGDLLNIEIAKATISKNQYGNILQMRTNWSVYALDQIDMFAHLTVFFPQLVKDLKVDSWEELDPFDLKELFDIYKNQFLPWFKNFSDVLSKVGNKEEESDESKESAE